MNEQYSSWFAMVGMRFARGFVAGALGSMTMLLTASPLSLEALLSNYKAWLFSIISGGITGALLSADKALRADGTDYKS